MQVIVQWSELFDAILGRQTVNKNLTYRLLHYCIMTESDGTTLLYNNLTKELLSLDSDERREVLDDKTNFENELIIYLIEHRFLVPIDNDDFSLRNQVVAFLKNVKDKKRVTSFDILTTTACNARCFYCFENGVGKKWMSLTTARQVAKYIINKSANQKVTIQWFGGEPLYNSAAIDVISEELLASGVVFDSTMTSNGYLFDLDKIINAKNTWHLRTVQITIDGKRDTYNRVKNYIYDDDNAYEKVLNNIGMLLDNGIQVLIRLNMDFYNASELFELLDELAVRFSGKRQCRIHAVMLYENIGTNKHIRSDEARKKLAGQHKLLTEKIKELGFSNNRTTLNNSIKTACCMSDSPNAVMILPDGHLGKCEHHLDDGMFGHILDDPKIPYWIEYIQSNEQCATCPAYPTCFKLSDCEYYKHECYDFERENKINDLKERIEYTYRHKTKTERNNEIQIC